jgi:hypothetical protein
MHRSQHEPVRSRQLAGRISELKTAPNDPSPRQGQVGLRPRVGNEAAR